MGDIDGVSELWYWKAFDQKFTLHPDAWSMHAIDRSDTFNMNRKKGSSAKTPDDFFPRMKKKKGMTTNQVASLIKRFPKKTP